ncbi:MAG: argininosuccinate synthase [Planctomyces sp.]|nr:argininosuccinate synthase [Planctomyces sp.]MBA4120625.1 argininosuccinate synthase [Isosphaera sp.]
MATRGTFQKIVVAYSGGLDTSAVIPWLKEHYGCKVYAVVGDVGQGAEELAGVEKKATDSGAQECKVVDLRRRFVEEFCLPMAISGAVYEGRYLLGTSIARPILAQAQVEYARAVGGDALAHGCTGKGNDQVRFESTYAALAPDLGIVAPWRLWDLRSREDLLAYLKKHNVPTTASATKLYSRDRNLWHISHEGGDLEDPWKAPPEDVWMLTQSPQSAPDTPVDLTLAFERGRPVSLDGAAHTPEGLIGRLNEIGGLHGVGRVDLVENRRVGMKSRGAYETPGGTVLLEALRGLEQLVLDRETLRLREQLALRFADVIYDGQWFTPLRQALWAALEKIAEPMTGQVTVRLYKGTARTVRRRSPNSLYAEAFATFGRDEVYNQQDAGGFIRLFSLPSRIAALKQLEAQRAPGP